MGLLGARRKRRLVPSRWGITAVDVAVGDRLAETIREYADVGAALCGAYLDNKYLAVAALDPLRFVYLERWVS